LADIRSEGGECHVIGLVAALVLFPVGVAGAL
jgi:hypothetical protein